MNRPSEGRLNRLEYAHDQLHTAARACAQCVRTLRELGYEAPGALGTAAPRLKAYAASVWSLRDAEETALHVGRGEGAAATGANGDGGAL